MKVSNHRTDYGANVYLEEYNNIREFINTTDGRSYNSWATDTGCHQHPPTEEDRQELMYGWKKFTDELKVELSKSENIKTRDKALKQKLYAIKGYYPNVGKALRGNQKCMGRYNKVRVSTKIVEIIWDCGALCNVRPERIKTQGTKLLTKIKELELMGFRVRLMVQGFKGSQTVNNNYMARIILKDENQPLDLMRISYPLANVEMLRTWIFHWYEHLPNAEYIDGYGKSLYSWADSRRREALLKAVNVKPNQYYINLNTDIDNTFKKLEGGK